MPQGPSRTGSASSPRLIPDSRFGEGRKEQIMSAPPTRHDEGGQTTPAYGPIDDLDLKWTVAQVLDHWPCAGMAVAVIRDGALAWFHGHGVAEVGVGHAGHRGNCLPHRIDHQDLHGDRCDAAVGTRACGPRCARQRLPPHIPAGPRQGELSAGDSAAPPDPYGRSRFGGGCRICFSQRFGWERHDRGARPSLRTTTAEACLWKWSRGASGCTPTTGSPHSGRSSRT